MNVIARLELEPAYNNSAVLRFNPNTQLKLMMVFINEESSVNIIIALNGGKSISRWHWIMGSFCNDDQVVSGECDLCDDNTVSDDDDNDMNIFNMLEIVQLEIVQCMHLICMLMLDQTVLIFHDYHWQSSMLRTRGRS